MALRSGYKGFKKLLPGLKLFRPGTLGIDNDVLISELNKTFFPRSEQAVLGAKNILRPSTTATINGVTFTVNSDGSVTLSGTASADTGFNIGDYFEIKDGEYIVSAGTVRVPYIYLNKRKGTGTPISAGVNTSSGEAKFTVNTADYDQYRATIWVTNGSNFTTPVTLYPMIRLASDPDATYVPYAMTNRELTEKNVQISNVFGQVYARKVGFIVALSFSGTTVVEEDGKTLGTLSAEYRPKSNVLMYAKVFNGSQYVDAQIKITATSGVVELLALSGSVVEGARVDYMPIRPIYMI